LIQNLPFVILVLKNSEQRVLLRIKTKTTSLQAYYTWI